ncbi:MAG TPA: 30S ribosomal protein THX [Cyclobacteriaceae bacterium]|nr:30S ribosomal protein THX [Cyclobacteriaceae bacterium]
MGKGDKKSKKGKIWRGSYGVSRPRPRAGFVAAKSAEGAVSEVAAEKPKKATAKKAARKKTTKE